MPTSRQALRRKADALIRTARHDPALGAVALHTLVTQARQLAFSAGDAVLEGEALLQLGRRFAPAANAFQALHDVRLAERIFRANGLEHKAAAAQVAAAQMQFDLGLERAAITSATAALEASTTLPVPDRAAASILIGLCHSQLGELDLALHELHQHALPLALRCADRSIAARVTWAEGLNAIRLLIWHRHRPLWRGWPGMPPITTVVPTPGATAVLFKRAQDEMPAGQHWPYIDMGLQFALGLEGGYAVPCRELRRMAGHYRESDPPLAARALYCVGMILRRHHHAKRALEAFQGALGLAEASSSRAIVRDVLLQISRASETLGDSATALQAYERFADMRLWSLLPLPPTLPAANAAAAAGAHSAGPGSDPLGLAGQISVAAAARNLEPLTLQRAQQYIDAHRGQPMTVQAVAARCGVSRRTLEQLFREFRGDTVKRCIRRVNLAHASEQLRCTSLPVTAVALAIGYRSASAFGREFFAAYGLTPSAWRKARRESLDPDMTPD